MDVISKLTLTNPTKLEIATCTPDMNTASLFKNQNGTIRTGERVKNLLQVVEYILNADRRISRTPFALTLTTLKWLIALYKII